MPTLHRLLLVCPALLLLAFAAACGDTGEECGNGTRERNEICDDGNDVDGDGCESDCTPTGADRCQDGRRDASEACDDGNAVPNDGCEPDCTVTPGSSVCGNGQQEGSEQCDDGNTQNGDGCESNCKIPGPNGTCGNGVLEGTEACDDGNEVALDGCETNCTVTTTTVEQCPGASLPKPATGTCEVTAGDGAKLFTAVVLAESGVLNGGQVLVNAAGEIACVACDCSGAAGAATATQVVCPGAVLSPALINAHDHITFQANPYKDTTGERYEHRHDWRRGNDGHKSIPSGGSASAAAIRWAELRQVMAGTTSIFGSGGQNGLLRNIDRAAQQEGLGLTAARYETFPLGDSGGTELTQGCGYPSIDAPSAVPADAAYLPHIAEGIEKSARNEFLCLSGSDPSGQDVITPRTAVIHGIGLRAVDIGLMAADGAGLIWSPRSNISLYGNTAAVTTYSRLGVRIALGTDWLISGSMNTLRELQCADYLNQSFFGRHFTDEQLWKMTTAWAADVTQISSRLGRIGVGKTADLAVFRGRPGSPFRAVIAANPDDVVLTMRGGKPLYGDANVITGLGAPDCDALEVCQTQKSVCLKGETNETLAQLQAANGDRYPLFSCTAPPPDEPSCSPARAAQWSVAGSTTYSGTASADDSDGDGIPNAQDNCAGVFNPIRPMDEGQQPDQDGDGQGDVCDVCPLDANGTTCSTPNPDDADNDGKPNAQDNCPSDPNPLQEDQDNDGKGDACDSCPVSNPGAAACPVTVYAVKTGAVAVGQKVAVPNLLVTGVARPVGAATSSTGFFAQTVSGDPGYNGVDRSGIFVFAPGHTLQVGQRVDVTSATVQNFFGQIQLSGGPTLAPGATGQGAPTPVTVTPAEITTGGARAAALESVLVRVENVTVTDIAPVPGAGDAAPTNEFAVTGSLRVNDLLHLVTPFPAVSETFAAITGVLDWRNNHSKLEPRGDADFQRGPPVLAGIGPSPSYVRVGQSGSSFPTALAVSMTSAPSTDTFVTVTSAEASVTVDGGGVTVLAGQTSAVVSLTGVSQDDSVTLTASLGAISHTATVRVLGASEPSSVSALECAAGAAPGGKALCTVRLDLPPATDAAVTLTLNPSAFGSVPATVTVPANALSATFEVSVAPGAMGQATVQASFGGQSRSDDVVALTGGSGLVINEVDYDQTATDTAEFVEIFNAGPVPVSLVGLKLVFINGAVGNPEYFPLGGTNRLSLDAAATTLQPGEYLLVANAGVAAPQGTLRINIPNDAIQNGAPDAIAIYDSVAKKLVDSLSYEGTVGTATFDGVTVTLQEGAAPTTALVDLNTGSKSLARVPNGVDTNVNATDFVVVDVPTPAAAN